MRLLLSRNLLSWLCLLVFGLNSVLLQGGVVLCSDASGKARLEWGCERTLQGHCTESIETALPGGSHESELPPPCDDTPAKHLIGNAIPAKSTAVDALKSAMTFVALPQLVSLEIPRLPQSKLPRGNPQPPTSVARLRTTILVV